MRGIPVCALLLALLTSCAATMPTGSVGYLPAESRTICYSTCQQLGLEMSAVVVISNSVGCVCQPAAGSAAPVASGGIAAAAGAMIVEQEEQARAAAQQSTYSTTTYH
jgi:hypothetical protein